MYFSTCVFCNCILGETPGQKKDAQALRAATQILSLYAVGCRASPSQPRTWRPAWNPPTWARLEPRLRLSAGIRPIREHNTTFYQAAAAFIDLYSLVCLKPQGPSPPMYVCLTVYTSLTPRVYFRYFS